MAAGITQAAIPKCKKLFCTVPEQTLREALNQMNGDQPSSIPRVVRLLENPASPIALPGNIDLYRHDCLHLLLNRGFSLEDEAFVIGFTMGNDASTRWLHLEIFKLCSWLIYPTPYRFRRAHFRLFHWGVRCGRESRLRNLNRFDFQAYEHKPLGELRHMLGISPALTAVTHSLLPPSGPLHTVTQAPV